MTQEATESTPQGSDDPKKVAIRFKPHARGRKGGQLRYLDPEAAKELVDNGHAKYVGKDA